VIYRDTSATVKLVVAESESAALIAWLNDRSDVALATSVIGHIEVLRAARRIGDAAVLGAQRLSASIDKLVLTEAVVWSAQAIGAAELRTLDAIHLATAVVHRAAITDLCVYDVRLAAAAAAEGFVGSRCSCRYAAVTTCGMSLPWRWLISTNLSESSATAGC